MDRVIRRDRGGDHAVGKGREDRLAKCRFFLEIKMIPDNKRNKTGITFVDLNDIGADTKNNGHPGKRVSIGRHLFFSLKTITLPRINAVKELGILQQIDDTEHLRPSFHGYLEFMRLNRVSLQGMMIVFIAEINIKFLRLLQIVSDGLLVFFLNGDPLDRRMTVFAVELSVAIFVKRQGKRNVGPRERKRP